MEKPTIFKKGDKLKPNGSVKSSKGYDLSRFPKVEVVSVIPAKQQWGYNYKESVRVKILELADHVVVDKSYVKVGNQIVIMSSAMEKYDSFEDNFQIY